MKFILSILLIVTICFGAKLMRAPNIEANPDDVNSKSRVVKKGMTITSPDQHLISSIPDLRSTAGTPGKNIVFAEDGQNVVVLYSRFSGDPENFFRVYVSYSTNRGSDWIHYGPLSLIDSRRSYPGVDAEPDWPSTGSVHLVWQETPQVGGNYDSSIIYYSKEVDYPNGLITAPAALPNSGSWDIWQPCIGVKDSFVIITGANNNTYRTTNDCYIWRSTDFGETWDTGRIYFPGPLDWMASPHFRFGSDGYMFFLWNRQQESNPELYWPYFCESDDYGETWSQPQLIWQDTPPYQDMSNVSGWWYMYDCEVVNDTPVATVKLGTANLDYGEIWVYRPDSGGPRNWHFKGTKLVGGDSAAPQTYARFPTVAADGNGNIFIGYQAFLIIPGDTVFDCGLFVRPAGQDTWIDMGRCTFNGDALEENHLEFAHNVPMSGDTSLIGMIYHNAGDYPETGNLYFDCYYYTGPGIVESEHPGLKRFSVNVSPNPFSNLVKFFLAPNLGKIKLSVFDVTGKLVNELETDKPTITWNGRKKDGNLTNSGVYFYNLSSGNYQYQGKVILTR